ncbi:hypothetical protein DBZ36_12870 [Alginatibacterium sediminis]|uniref:Uncharacterized protein n=1 Tax=Alginatibacterium sediminis TaxID=2164068 RepID=A0A420EBR8_9ALTE|nr:hypothetical protein [Alginatibacterium sediminis]RKF18121.1 hypothetical protein DBZ36_12870 [Alginatibacterium sediminis]
MRLKLVFFVLASLAAAWYITLQVRAHNQLQFRSSQVCQAAIASEFFVAMVSDVQQTAPGQYRVFQANVDCQIEDQALLLRYLEQQQIYRFEHQQDQLTMIRVNLDRPNRIRLFSLSEFKQSEVNLDLAHALRRLFGESAQGEQAIEQSIVLQKSNYICAYSEIERVNIRTLYRNPEDFEPVQTSSVFLDHAEVLMPYLETLLVQSLLDDETLVLYRQRLHELSLQFKQKMPEQMRWLEQSETKPLEWLQTELLNYHLSDFAKLNPRLHIPKSCEDLSSLDEQLSRLLSPAIVTP